MKNFFKFVLTHGTIIITSLVIFSVVLLLWLLPRPIPSNSSTSSEVFTSEQQSDTSEQHPETSEQQDDVSEQLILPVRYQVTEGDSLWKVAEQFYGDGEKYVLLAKANGLTSNARLEIGQELMIPRIDAGRVVGLEEEIVLPKTSEIQETWYEIKSGDSLWSIAEEQFGSGQRWSELYQQNKNVIGENPDLIYSGTILTFSTDETNSSAVEHF